VTAVVIDDLSTITKVAGVLQSAGKHYTVRGEGTTSLMDLRNGPSVIVGAFDNAWTLRLLRPLRYHFANNPTMTVFSIIDSSAPGKAGWVVDRAQQIATGNYMDYAIVARFTDTTTGKPTLIAAGIGRGRNHRRRRISHQPGPDAAGAQSKFLRKSEERGSGSEHANHRR
jgi:hypothetical protein